MIIDAQFLHTLDRFHWHTQISHQSGPNKLSFGEQKRPYTKCWETTVQQRGTPRIAGSLMLYVPEPSMTKKKLASSCIRKRSKSHRLADLQPQEEPHFLATQFEISSQVLQCCLCISTCPLISSDRDVPTSAVRLGSFHIWTLWFRCLVTTFWATAGGLHWCEVFLLQLRYINSVLCHRKRVEKAPLQCCCSCEASMDGLQSRQLPDMTHKVPWISSVLFPFGTGFRLAGLPLMWHPQILNTVAAPWQFLQDQNQNETSLQDMIASLKDKLSYATPDQIILRRVWVAGRWCTASPATIMSLWWSNLSSWFVAIRNADNGLRSCRSLAFETETLSGGKSRNTLAIITVWVRLVSTHRDFWNVHWQGRDRRTFWFHTFYFAWCDSCS